AMVRPRGGDFLYTEAEFATMLADVALMRDSGIAGVVAGCLVPDGRIDLPRMAQIVVAADGLPVTCHRAFDMTRDPFEALEALIAAGVTRVLTSGQKAHVREGMPLLHALVARARGRITILVCGALSPAEMDPGDTGLTGYEFHFGAGTIWDSPMAYRNPDVFMGMDAATSPEYLRRRLDTAALPAMIARARGA
ncbi:MAG TPA: copper homeostasis protein CutC, partial [Paenirhodobacter sp.]